MVGGARSRRSWMLSQRPRARPQGEVEGVRSQGGADLMVGTLKQPTGIPPLKMETQVEITG